MKSKLAVARVLGSSKDPITSEIGNHLLEALTARSLRDAIPHFNVLKELLPNINSSHIEIIFAAPLLNFVMIDRFAKKDPAFTKRLYFNDMRKVFVHGSLMIGAYDSRSTYGGKGVPPHLLAYDMNTEKMVWGIPLTPILSEDPSLNTNATPVLFGFPRMGPAGYSLKRVGELLSLQFEKEKTLHFIHPETGEYNFTLELPKAPTDRYILVFILAQKGFAYQMVCKDEDRILIGGRIVDKRWNSTFEVKTPSECSVLFLPIVGFQKTLKIVWFYLDLRDQVNHRRLYGSKSSR